MLYRSDFQVLGKGQWGSLGHCCSAPDGFYYWMEDRKVWRWLGTREAVLWAILNRTNSTDLVGSARTPAWDIEADMQNASYVIFWCTAPLIYISIYIFWWTLCSFWNFHLFLFLCDNSKLEVLFCLFYIFTVGICHFIKGGCCCEYTLVLLGFFWSPQRRIPKGRTCASLRLSPCSLQGFTLRKKYLLQKLRDGPGKILYWEVVRERVLKSTERFFNSGV